MGSSHPFSILVVFLLPQLAMCGFWRMNCGKIQTGRIDPVVSPGRTSSHVHNIVGSFNIGLNSTYDDLMRSKCTSCEITADKSAYWTPQLYYQYPNGSFQTVHNGGMIVYYLGRAGNNLTAFPPGFRMLSGVSSSRKFDNTAKTWDGGRNIADRVSFVCINPKAPGGVQWQTANMTHFDCPNGLRAQIHFQACWDGINLYKTDNSHVAYLSRIGNGKCPPTHPVKFINLFYEVYYSVNDAKLQKQPGGQFIFSNGDTTGYGFHGDFYNGWDTKVLDAALKRCAVGDNKSGTIQDCPPLAAVNSHTYSRDCPEKPPLEKVTGMLNKLPGCNPVHYGEHSASMGQTACSD